MMISISQRSLLQSVLRPLCVILLASSASSLQAQPGRSSGPPSTRVIEQQAEKAETEYLKSLVDVATKYEEAGEFEKAGETLRRILQIKPDVESVKMKLQQFEEKVFLDNVKTLELDASGTWVQVGLTVRKDEPLRIESEGTYRIVISEQLGPAGYPAGNPAVDAAPGVPFGALMAVVAPESQNARRGRNQPEPKPIFIGNAAEVKPDSSGVLLFRLNVPPSAKVTGRVKLRITGNFSAGR